MDPAVLEHEKQATEEKQQPLEQRWGDKLLLLFLLVTAAASIAIFILQSISPDFFAGLAVRLAPDRSLAPATRSFLKQAIEVASLLLSVLSLYGLIMFYLPKERHQKALAIFVSAAAVLHWLYYYPFTVDDAYISLVYARNLASGNGPVFNIGERVEGYTNLLWVLLESAFFKIRLDPLIGIKLVGIMCGLGVLFLTYRITRLLIEDLDFAFLAPLLLAISAPFATASAIGLETQLFTLLIVSAVYLYLKSDDNVPGYAASLLLALATLTRPEGILFFGAIYAHSFISLVLKRRFSVRLFLSGLLFAAIVAAHLGWRHAYYGSFLPNTYYAKLEGSHWRAAWGLLYLKRFFSAYGGSLYIVCLIPFIRRKQFRKNSLLFLITAPFLLYVAYAGGDWIPQFRFAEPVMPFLMILFAAGLSELFSSVRRRIRVSLLAKVVLLLLAGFLFLFFISDSVPVHRFVMTRAGGAKKSHVYLGKWLRENSSPDESIALMDIGMVKYFSNREVIDISGLTDEHVAHLPGGFLRKQFDIEYLLKKNPRYVVLVSHNDIANGGEFISSYPIDKSIYENPQFRERYEFLFNVDHMYLRDQLKPDNGYWLNVFERKSVQEE